MSAVDPNKAELIKKLETTQGKLQEWKKALDSKETGATATASRLGEEVLTGLKESSKMFNEYIKQEKVAVPAPEPAKLPIDDDTATEDLGTGSSGGRRKKTTRKLKGGQQATEVKEFGAPNNNLIYNAAGLITDARNPVTVGLTGTERLIDTHAPFSTGMDTGAFSGTDNLPPTITSQITPVLGYSGGAKSKKRVTKRK